MPRGALGIDGLERGPDVRGCAGGIRERWLADGADGCGPAVEGRAGSVSGVEGRAGNVPGPAGKVVGRSGRFSIGGRVAGGGTTT
ncbi:MAG: hypothetical protein E4H19_14565 [Chromatiales bacterium]|nr:MAG: hypothetical protein E4H19_14565 [Chromatiales bacterium]